MWLLYVLLAVLLIAGLAAGCALGLHLLAPGWSERKRTLVSAAIAAGLPMIVVFWGFLAEANVSDDEFGMGLTALIVLQLLILTICALPPAWLTTTKLGKGAGTAPAALPDADDPQLIEG